MEGKLFVKSEKVERDFFSFLLLPPSLVPSLPTLIYYGNFILGKYVT
jgi:hypothetical protein